MMVVSLQPRLARTPAGCSRLLLDTGEFPATGTGYSQLLDWTYQFGSVLRAGVECTGSYGAGLARYLAIQQVPVVEVNQPDRSARRRRGRTDAVDAESAARAALSGTPRALPKSGEGQVEVLRMLQLAKNSAVKARTQALNQLKTDPCDRSPAADAAIFTLRLLAQRVLELHVGRGLRECLMCLLSAWKLRRAVVAASARKVLTRAAMPASRSARRCCPDLRG